jgi:hypothetical protein
MAYLTSIDTSALNNQNINTALLVHTFTNTVRVRKVWFNVFVKDIVGGGDYVVHLTWNRAGAGTYYESIKTTKTVAVGVTTTVFDTIPLIVDAAAVVRVYVLGLAGDSIGAVDIITDVYEELIAVDASGYVSLLAQDIRDAMKLAPTAGAAAAGSVDTHLDDILTDTAEIGVAGAGLTALGDVRIANLDTTVSSRSTVAQVNVVLARIGAFTGAGLSTIMGWLRAMMRKTAALTPGDVGGTFDNTTDSLEAIRDKIGSGTIVVTGPVVTTDGDVVTYRGDTYLNEDGRAIDWESDDWPDLTGGSVKVIIDKLVQFNGSVVTPVGTVKVRLELTATQSRSIAAGRHNFQVVATQTDGDVATLVAAAWVSRARAEV